MDLNHLFFRERVNVVEKPGIIIETHEIERLGDAAVVMSTSYAGKGKIKNSRREIIDHRNREGVVKKVRKHHVEEIPRLG